MVQVALLFGTFFWPKDISMPKSYGRNERIAAAILREAAQVLAKDIKDPRVSLSTVTEVQVSPDLRNATIFVSFLNDDDAQVKEAMKALEKAKGFVRSTLAARLKLRYMPNIHFRFDSLIKDSMRLDALIAKGLGPKDDIAAESDYEDESAPADAPESAAESSDK